MTEKTIGLNSGYNGFIHRKRLFISALALFTLIMFIAAIALGSSFIPIKRVIAALLGQGTENENIIIWNLRFPRACTAVIAGFGLGMTGCVMQGILRNPLASASTIGVSQGAAFGAAFAIIVLGGGIMSGGTSNIKLSVNSPAVTTICAFIGSMISTVIIIVLSRFHRAGAGILILAGTALGSLFSAGTTLLEYFADDVKVAAVVYWTFGDIGSTFFREILIMAVVVLISGIYFRLNCWNYNALLSGENTAKGLGVNTGKIMLAGMAVCSLCASTIVSYIGIINFVGLIAPHMVKRYSGSDYRFLLPAAGLAGAVLMLFSDIVSRLLISPVVLPIGAITSILGAPVFLWIIFKGRWNHD